LARAGGSSMAGTIFRGKAWMLLLCLAGCSQVPYTPAAPAPTAARGAEPEPVLMPPLAQPPVQTLPPPRPTPTLPPPKTGGAAKNGHRRPPLVEDDIIRGGDGGHRVPLTPDTILRFVPDQNGQVAIAREKLNEAYACQCLAEKACLPDMYVGPAYYRHEGG